MASWSGELVATKNIKRLLAQLLTLCVWAVGSDMRVSLLGGAPNLRAVHSSKAVGEPPFFLSSCVFFALKHAVNEARAEWLGVEALHTYVPLDAPLTGNQSAKKTP